MHTYSETRLMPYTLEQMFALVLDVESYPQFLPWCLGAQVLEKKSPTCHLAKLTAGYGPFRESFVSEVTLKSPEWIETRCVDGPFSCLVSRWDFAPEGQGCRVTFGVDFAFRSAFLNAVMGLFFHEAQRRMVLAFETRAAELFKPAKAAGSR